MTDGVLGRPGRCAAIPDKVAPAFKRVIAALRPATLKAGVLSETPKGAVAELVGIEVGVVSGVINLESSGVEASDWRLR
ncbi:MAG: hypothetical protein E6699_28180, partial [Bradyrhizobium sp.]|uniref:hypothetical protein n=3 Tax=Bradyrhizobium TaxID=374 RepID=UPI0029044759